MKTFELTLSDPVKFHKAGQSEESCCLVFTAPSVKNRKKVARLQQGFMQSISDLKIEGKEPEKGKKPEQIKPHEILSVLQMSKIDYETYVENFVGLISNGVCKIDESVDMTEKILEDVSCEDFDRIMGEYLANFILGSLGE